MEERGIEVNKIYCWIIEICRRAIESPCANRKLLHSLGTKWWCTSRHFSWASMFVSIMLDCFYTSFDPSIDDRYVFSIPFCICETEPHIHSLTLIFGLRFPIIVTNCLLNRMTISFVAYKSEMPYGCQRTHSRFCSLRMSTCACIHN